MGLRDKLYDWRIRRGLDRAYARAEPETAQLGEMRAVVFSDHHRGRLDGADDFRRCEPAYRAALGHYAERGFALWLLGDVEELWENRPEHVLSSYEQVLAMERSFGERLWRFFGNHDMAWRHERNVDAYLRRRLPDGARVRECVRLRLRDGERDAGTLFLVHGHQGTIDSGNLLVVPFSRFVVREVWARLQRAQGFASTAPSADARLRFRHDQAMFRWARRRAAREPLILFAGHTHHPVFPSDPPPDLKAETARRLAALEAARAATPPDEAAITRARAEYELARARSDRDDGYRPPDIVPPCYFNSGCCSFGDGDVTGLEIDRGTVRLVRWLDDGGAAVPHRLAEASLFDMLGALRAA